MDWAEIKVDLDTYLSDLPDPTDDDLRAIEADPDYLLTDAELYEWLLEMVEEPPLPSEKLRALLQGGNDAE